MSIPSIAKAAQTGVPREEVGDCAKEYLEFFDEVDCGNVQTRKSNYQGLVNNYYNLVTDFYENGWGESFHFAARFKEESLKASLVRHEHYIAHRLLLCPGARVLDLGCGIGGPMRTIARFSGATIVGINNNSYQIERGNARNRQYHMSHLCELVQGNFMQMAVEPESFDAAYAIEATCHAPNRLGVFEETFRALKPGGHFASYEWCVTDKYDQNNPEHRRIIRGIEEGDALPELVHTNTVLEGLAEAGFEVLESRDMVYDCDPETPWYLPLSSRDQSLTALRNTPTIRWVIQHLVELLELSRIAPKGSGTVHRLLCKAADHLVEGGEKEIFTPMFFVIARKPDGKKSS